MSHVEYKGSVIEYRGKNWQDLSIIVILLDPKSNIKKYTVLKDNVVFQTDFP